MWTSSVRRVLSSAIVLLKQRRREIEGKRCECFYFFFFFIFFFFLTLIFFRGTFPFSVVSLGVEMGLLVLLVAISMVAAQNVRYFAPVQSVAPCSTYLKAERVSVPGGVRFGIKDSFESFF
jgi:small neutral amino acid transporter SnatA (MarC family)